MRVHGPDGHQVVWNGALDRARHQRHQRVPETPRRRDDAALQQLVWAWLARRYPGSYTFQQIRHRMRLTEADVSRALSSLRAGHRVRQLVGRQRQRVTHYQAVAADGGKPRVLTPYVSDRLSVY